MQLLYSFSASVRAAAYNVTFFLFSLAVMLGPVAPLHGQGCIVARSPEQVLPGLSQGELPTNQGGYVSPRHFILTMSERHQFSFQHYVGDVYQEYRAQQQNAGGKPHQPGWTSI